MIVSRLLRALESKVMHYNKTINNIESDDSENMAAAGNDTEKNDDFPRDVHQDSDWFDKKEDFGAIANIEKDRSASVRQVISNVIKVQKDQMIQFKLAENGKEQKPKILGWARKASTKIKNWYNIKYRKPYDIKEASLSIDLLTVKNLKIKQIEIQTEELYISTNLDFSEAKGDELRKWKELDVYLAVENEGQKCMSSRWVNTVENDGDKIKLKSKLVVKGFEEDCLKEIHQQPTSHL